MIISEQQFFDYMFCPALFEMKYVRKMEIGNNVEALVKRTVLSMLKLHEHPVSGNIAGPSTTLSTIDLPSNYTSKLESE